MKTIEQDLTTGSVTGRLLRFSIPFLLANLCQALYSVVNMIIVGWCVGPSGVSAVQTGGQVMLLVTNVVVGLSMGATVLVAQYQGAKKTQDQRETIGTLFFLFGLIALGITVGLSFAASPILRLMSTPAEVFDSARAYLQVSLFGSIFIFGYNAIGGVLRVMGDSKNPLLFALFAAAINVGLDLLLVGVFGLGALGAAISTVVAQAAGFFAAVIFLRRRKFVFDFRLRSFRLFRDKAALIFRIGLPSAVQYSITGFSFFVLTGLSNQLAGVVGSTVMGIASRVNTFGLLPCLAMSSTLSSMAGQNIGADQPDRARRATLVGAVIALGISVVVSALIFIFPDELMALFLNGRAASTEKEIYDSCMRAGPSFLRLMSFEYLFASLFFCANGLAIGSGHTLFALINSAINALVFRVPMAYLLTSAPFSLGLDGLAAAMGFCAVVPMVIGIVFVLSGKWKKRVIPSLSS